MRKGGPGQSWVSWSIGARLTYGVALQGLAAALGKHGVPPDPCSNCPAFTSALGPPASTPDPPPAVVRPNYGHAANKIPDAGQRRHEPKARFAARAGCKEVAVHDQSVVSEEVRSELVQPMRVKPSF